MGRHCVMMEFCWAPIRACQTALTLCASGERVSLFLDINICIEGWQIFPPYPLSCPLLPFLPLGDWKEVTFYHIKCSRTYVKCSDSQAFYVATDKSWLMVEGLQTTHGIPAHLNILPKGVFHVHLLSPYGEVFVMEWCGISKDSKMKHRKYLWSPGEMEGWPKI